MDWKDFFQLSVKVENQHGLRPYFNSQLNINTNIQMQDLLMERFDRWQLTPSESKRLTMDMRKILHCLHYFNSKEFDRVFDNFLQRLCTEKGDQLKFYTQGGGVYLFLAAMKHLGSELKEKSIICITSEIPLPVVRIPLKNRGNLRLIHQAHAVSYFGSFPSLWARPEIIGLFDKKDWNSQVA